MYNFTDRSDRPLTLRPEGTAPICRAYIEHGMHREPQPVKAYTIAPMYRYGAPGRGRYREHYQLSVEAIGTADPAIDAEIIQLYHELLRRLGVTKWELHLNSIGDANCRPQYVERLNAWLDEHADVLDDDARHKRATSPLQVFDVKTPSVRAALEDAPKIGESLCDDCRAHFDAVRRQLDLYGVPYVDRPDARPRARLLLAHDVRVHRPGRERQLDDLRRRPLRRARRADRRPADPGDRVRRRPRAPAARARERGHHRRRSRASRCSSSSTTRRRATTLCRRWPSCAAPGVSADTDYAGRSFKGQMTQAGRSGAHTVVIVRAGGATIKRDGRDEQSVALAEVVATLTA